MDDSTLSRLSKSLDDAIAATANQRFDDLTRGLDKKEIANRIVGALRSLLRLQEGAKPTYDAWDAVFYALWYQPGQINLAYTLARALLDDPRNGESFLRLDDGWSLNVNDFGCGAWAMQIGLAIAVADLKHPSQSAPAVTINLEDESNAMIEMGKRYGERFALRFGVN